MTPEEFNLQVAQQMPEAVLQARVDRLLSELGWLSYHTHDSRRSAAGFPDVLAVRATTGQLAALELKSHTGRLRPAQRVWLAALGQLKARHPGVFVVEVVRPMDYLSGDLARLLA